MEKTKSLKKLINQYNEVKNLKEGILFNDTYFSPSDKSIFSSNPLYKNKKIIKPQIYLQLDPDFSKSQYTSLSKDIKYHWKNISSFINDYNIIKDNENLEEDIIQGNIANSYFISTLKFLSEKPEQIKSLFNIEKNNKNYFALNIYIHGYKYNIIIDNNFPFIENKEQNYELIFTRINNKTKNIWPLILEKIWAKLNSSYEDIIEGKISDVFYCFTPCPIKIYYHDIKYNNLFEKIKNAVDNNFIVCTDINTKKENPLLKKLGVISNHSYRIIGYGILHDSEGNLINLIKIYNKYEITTWIGDWSNNSNKWNEEFKRYLNYDPDNDKNIFYININDYLKFYSTTYILYCHEKYFYFFNKINITGINQPFTCCKILFNKILLSDDNHNNVTYFIINTKNKRFQNKFKGKKNFENIFKNIYLYKKSENENLILIDSICGKEERIFLSINNALIQQGDEYILFISFPYLEDNKKKIELKKNFSINPKRPNNICVGVYTNIVKENKDIIINSIENKENIEKYIIKSIYEKSKFNSHLYYFDKEKERDTSRSINFENEKGAYGYLVLDNRSNAALYEKLTFFDYDNINILFFIKPLNIKQKNIINNNPNINSINTQEINTELIKDINTRKIINSLLKEKYINSFEETKLNIYNINNKEKNTFELLIKLGAKTILLLIFEKCDDFAFINIKSQINFLYPLYMIISEKKFNTNVINKLEYKEKKIEIFENIIEHNYGVVFYYINKEEELNANINITFKEIKNLSFDLNSDLITDNDEKNITIIKDDENNNDNIIGIEIKLKPLTNIFFSLKAKNIFDNFSYSFENKYTIYY